MKEPKTRCQQIERSIIKNYRKEIWRPFVDALNEYKICLLYTSAIRLSTLNQ